MMNGTTQTRYNEYGNTGMCSGTDSSDFRKNIGKDSCAYYVGLLCERYKERGISARMRVDAAKQERSESLSRAMKPGEYVNAEIVSGGVVNKYKSGEYEGKRYMTSEDFVAYFNDQRRYKSPKYENIPAAERNSASLAESGTPPKKAGWLTVTERTPKLLRKLAAYPLIEKLDKLAGEWFPKDNEENRREGVKRKFPITAVASIAALAVSLTMIIGSTVMVSLETGNLSRAKSELGELQDKRDKLESELDVKNDMIYFDTYAREKLNMVRSEFVNSQTVSLSDGNRIESLDEDENTSYITQLLSAFGGK